MRILVVGGTGFIGKHLVSRLSSLGALVTVATRSPPLENASKTYVHFSVANQSDQEWEAATMSVDVVVHVAHGGTPASANADMPQDLQRSVLSALAMLRACEKNGVRRVVFASSGGTVYGRQVANQPTSESQLTNPVSAYGIHKLAIEKYIGLFHIRNGLEYQILRISNPYGPTQTSTLGFGVIPSFLNAVMRGHPINIIGDGTATRDFLFITDLLDAFVSACVNAAPTNLLNIGSGIGVDLNTLVKIICEVAHRRSEVVYLPERGFDLPYSVLDVSLAGQEYGWAPQIDLQSGLETTMKSWIESNG